MARISSLSDLRATDYFGVVGLVNYANQAGSAGRRQRRGFLTDEDFNVAMMSGDTLEQFHSCPECGGEGFAEDLPDNECCQQYLKEVQQ